MLNAQRNAQYAAVAKVDCKHGRLAAYHMPVVGMIWISSAQKIELWVVLLSGQNLALKQSPCMRKHPVMHVRGLKRHLISCSEAFGSAPFFATNCAVLSTMALISGGGWMRPIALVCVSTLTPTRLGDGRTLLTGPAGTIAPGPGSVC